MLQYLDHANKAQQITEKGSTELDGLLDTSTLLGLMSLIVAVMEAQSNKRLPFPIHLVF